MLISTDEINKVKLLELERLFVQLRRLEDMFGHFHPELTKRIFSVREEANNIIQGMETSDGR